MFLRATANDYSTGVGVLYRRLDNGATVIQRVFGGLMVMDSAFCACTNEKPSHRCSYINIFLVSLSRLRRRPGELLDIHVIPLPVSGEVQVKSLRAFVPRSFQIITWVMMFVSMLPGISHRSGWGETLPSPHPTIECSIGGPCTSLCKSGIHKPGYLSLKYATSAELSMVVTVMRKHVPGIFGVFQL